MSEPTSTLTLEDLVIEVARKASIAYYGADGDEPASVPVDAHDLDECKRHVNNAIRMFLSDAPPSGWRWTRPTAEIIIWGTLAVDATNLLTSAGYDAPTDKTTLNASADAFYPSMELKPLVITGVGTFTITDYVSSTQVKVQGDASTAAGDTWSITADGNYTLPRTFGGEYTGLITYTSGSNQGASLSWSSEAEIRKWRENATTDTGDPWLAAVRVMDTGSPRRRWELMLYPLPDELMVVEFPFTLHFDKLVELDEVHPAPFLHDETVKAACLAIVEKDVDDVQGANWQDYTNRCLRNSYRIDGQSAPKNLGYFGNPRSVSGAEAIRTFRQSLYQRPTVSFNS